MKPLFFIYFFIPSVVFAADEEFDYKDGIPPDSSVISNIFSYFERHTVIVTLFITLSIVFGVSYWLKEKYKVRKKSKDKKIKLIFSRFKFGKK